MNQKMTEKKGFQASPFKGKQPKILPNYKLRHLKAEPIQNPKSKIQNRLTPKIPNDQTRQRLRESLEDASAGIKEFSAEIQAITDELERKYAQSPIGQFHARRQT